MTTNTNRAAKTTKTTTTPAPDHTADILRYSARQIGAALMGIEAIAEVLTGVEVDRQTHASDTGRPSDWLEPMTAERVIGLYAAAGALARYVRHDLQRVMCDDAEDRMMWGGAWHLYPSVRETGGAA